MKKVLLISYRFPPSAGGGVLRAAKFVKYLPEFGWQPIVLTTRPAPDEFHAASLLAEVPASTRIVQTDRPPEFAWLARRRWGRGLLRAVLRPEPLALWRRIALPAAQSLVQAESPAAIVSTSPPVTAHLVGFHLHQVTRLPWILDFRDLWTDNFTYRPITYVHGLLDARLEARFVRAATAVTCVTEGFRRALLARHNSARPEKYVVIPNGYDEADFAQLAPSWGGRFRLTHSGDLYDFTIRPRPQGWKRFFEPLLSGEGPAVMVRSPRSVLQAVSELVRENPDKREKIEIVFVGNMPQVFSNEIENMGISDLVTRTGYLDHPDALALMQAADVLFLIQRGEGSEIVVPGKLFEYLRTGNPVLAEMPDGEAPRILRRLRGGEVVAPNDVEAMKGIIGSWFRLWERGERPAPPDWDSLRRFERRYTASELASLLDSVT